MDRLYHFVLASSLFCISLSTFAAEDDITYLKHFPLKRWASIQPGSIQQLRIDTADHINWVNSDR
jgi:hypothetical protein